MEILHRDLPLDHEMIQELLDKFMTEQYQYPPNVESDSKIYSTWNNNMESHFPDKIEQWYKSTIKDVLVDLGLFGRVKAINSKWCQIYTNVTDGHNVHTHYSGEELLSWVHFVKTPPDQKCFFFVDSMSRKIYPDQDAGRLIVFPAWAMHGVDMIKDSEEPRMVVAGNVIARNYKSHPFDQEVFNIKRSPNGNVSWTTSRG